MTEMFQGLESLRQPRQVSLFGYCAAALAGWFKNLMAGGAPRAPSY